MSDKSSLPESVSSSFSRLTTAAGALNLVSDALGKAVADIDDGLKKLNLGITAWVKITYIDPDYPESSIYRIEEIGYTKIGGKWGTVLKTRTGDENDPSQDESVDIWAFNEAPRALRLKAIDKIPELLKALSEEAARVTKELQEKLVDAQAVAAAMNPEATDSNTASPKKRTLLQALGESQAKTMGLKPTKAFGEFQSGMLAASEENALGLASPEVKK